MRAIGVEARDLLGMLVELSHYRTQVVELQGRGTELVLENRELKEELEGMRTWFTRRGSRLATVLRERASADPTIEVKESVVRALRVCVGRARKAAMVAHPQVENNAAHRELHQALEELLSSVEAL